MTEYTTRVYLVGASGVGKTTLGRAAGAALDIPFYSVSPSAVYRDLGLTPGEVPADRAAAVQSAIRLYVASRLSALNDNRPYIVDRSVDALVYSALMGFAVPSDHERAITRAIYDGPGLVATAFVFVRPAPAVLEAARAEDAGRRAAFLTPEQVYRTDGGIQHYLVDRLIRYAEVPPDCVSLDDRIEIVRQAVENAPRNR